LETEATRGDFGILGAGLKASREEGKTIAKAKRRIKQLGYRYRKLFNGIFLLESVQKLVRGYEIF
tara:strand:+ start:217 stop:411 length:195 start_codon:yes stop_codon:yes gene_type:complete